MTLALRRFGVAVEPYVPSRLDEGHGLSLAAIEAAAAAGVERDRHRRLRARRASPRSPTPTRAGSTSSSPTTTASRPSCRRPSRSSTRTGRTPTYPDRRLAGSGVAFKIAQLLLADEPGGPAAALDLTDLATIGTVADVAPIVGENRAIARLGSSGSGRRRDRASPRSSRGPDRARGRRPRDVSFAIAPRLNAAGRVGEALEAARLLLTDDPAEAADPRRCARGGQPRPGAT